MLSRLDPRQRRLLGLVLEAAGGRTVALVGGAVRDLLLHRDHQDPWRGLPDLDLVVEDRDPSDRDSLPAAHRIALRLREQLGDTVRVCQLHRAFGTAELEIDGVVLDIATARQEQYATPGANPSVRFGSLVDDLARRDLSINAMALVLRPAAAGPQEELPAVAAGELLDPYGGQRDLAARRLRFLHPGSLRDDPSRVVRAARYGARLGMDLEPASRQQVETALVAWPWLRGAPAVGTRLLQEVELLLAREPWPAALALLQGWGGLALLHPQLQADHHWQRRLHQASRLRQRARLEAWPLEQWLLLALVAGLDDPLPLLERLQMPHRCQEQLRGVLRLRAWLAQPAALSTEGSPCRLSLALERQGFSPEMVALELVRGPWRHWRRGLLRWLLRWRTIVSPLSARQLIGQGMTPGPQLGRELERLRCERLERERW